MTRQTAENVANVAAYLARRKYRLGTELGQGHIIDCPPHVAAREASALARVARSLHRLSERACCEDLDRIYGEGYQERADNRLEAKARAIVAKFPGLRVYFQGDPRGWPIYIGGEDMDQSNYNSIGVGVTPHA